MMHELNSINLVTAQSLASGTFFRYAEQRELGLLCMRAKFNDEQAYVVLEGDDCFRVKVVQSNSYAIPVDVHSLHIQLDAAQPERTDEWEPGSLLVADTGAYATVYINGMAGTSRKFRLNLKTGMLSEADLAHYTCAANWRLVDCDEHGKETVLCTAGSTG